MGNGSTHAFKSGANIHDLTAGNIISVMANSANVQQIIDGTDHINEAHGTTYADGSNHFYIGSRDDNFTKLRGE